MGINKLVVLFFVSCSLAFPSQIVWRTLTPSYLYKDIFSVCQNLNSLSVEVGAEIRNGEVVAAALSGNPASQFSPRLILNPEERAGLVYQGGENPFIREIKLSPRMLNFIIERVNTLELDCARPAIRSIEMDSNIQFFNIDPTIGESTFHSEKVSWWGYRKDGWGWNIEIRLTQEPYKTQTE